MQKKKGISLIVLVITIIVMIILAAAVVVTLNNTGIINKADDAVNKTDKSQVTYLASMVWSEEYMNNKRGDTLKKDVLDRLKDYTDDYEITVTDKGVTVGDKNNIDNGGTTPDLEPEVVTLGSLVTAEDYGAKINYVADNGLSDWKVFYHTDEYVYLIASEELASNELPSDLLGKYKGVLIEKTVKISSTESKTVGQVFWRDLPETSEISEETSKKWMAEWPDYTSNHGLKCITILLNETLWSGFSNTTKYKDTDGLSYVKGAIGSPTLEMFVASWNAKREATNDTNTYNKKLEILPCEGVGYYINDITNGPVTSNKDFQRLSTGDRLYIWSLEKETTVWLASPSANGEDFVCLIDYSGLLSTSEFANSGRGFRPVVCISSKIPAKKNIEGEFEI